jgi:peptidoglycan/xylan/chitin deacetylase (PgdA/CDA1 family)
MATGAALGLKRGSRRRVLVTLALLVAGLTGSPAAQAQVFTPQAPADVSSTHAQVCRPAAPAGEKSPGRSVPIYKGPADCNAIAITFDAGADRGYAEDILNTLRDEHVPASFGMTGLWARDNADLVQRMSEEGHEFINHTWDHRSFTGVSDRLGGLGVAARRQEMDQTDELLAGVTGRSTRPLFRPPYGDVNEGVFKDVADNGYDYTIMWTVDSLGWMRVPVARIVNQCLGKAEPGAILLLHVGIESLDGPALPTIIAGLRERGYTFVTVSDLLGL